MPPCPSRRRTRYRPPINGCSAGSRPSRCCRWSMFAPYVRGSRSLMTEHAEVALVRTPRGRSAVAPSGRGALRARVVTTEEHTPNERHQPSKPHESPRLLSASVRDRSTAARRKVCRAMKRDGRLPRATRAVGIARRGEDRDRGLGSARERDHGADAMLTCCVVATAEGESRWLGVPGGVQTPRAALLDARNPLEYRYPSCYPAAPNEKSSLHSHTRDGPRGDVPLLRGGQQRVAVGRCGH